MNIILFIYYSENVFEGSRGSDYARVCVLYITKSSCACVYIFKCSHNAPQSPPYAVMDRYLRWLWKHVWI